jgi:hypothetical protein
LAAYVPRFIRLGSGHCTSTESAFTAPPRTSWEGFEMIVFGVVCLVAACRQQRENTEHECVTTYSIDRHESPFEKWKFGDFEPPASKSFS